MEHLPNYSVISDMVAELDQEFNLEDRLTRYKNLSPELINLALETGMEKEDDASMALFLADFVITSSEVTQGVSDEERRISIIKCFIEGLNSRTYAAENLLKIFYLSQKVSQAFRRNDYFLSGRGLDRETTLVILKDLFLMPYLEKSAEILGEGGPGWELSVLASAVKQTLPDQEMEKYSKLGKEDRLLPYIWNILKEFQKVHTVEINDTLSIPNIEHAQALVLSTYQDAKCGSLRGINKQPDHYEVVVLEELINFLNNHGDKSLQYIRGKVIGTDESLILVRHENVDGKPLILIKSKADEVNVTEMLSLLELKSKEGTQWKDISSEIRKFTTQEVVSEVIEVEIEVEIPYEEDVEEDYEIEVEEEFEKEIEEKVEITEEKEVEIEEEIIIDEEYTEEEVIEKEIEEMETYTYEEEIEVEVKPGFVGRLLGKKSKGTVTKTVNKTGKRPVKKIVKETVQHVKTRPVTKTIKKKVMKPFTRVETRKVVKKETRPVKKVEKRMVTKQRVRTEKRTEQKTVEKTVEKEVELLETYPEFVANALVSLSLGDLNLFEQWDIQREADYGIVGIVYSDYKKGKTTFHVEKVIGDLDELADLLDGLDKVIENAVSYYFEGEFQIMPSELLFFAQNGTRYFISFDGNSDRLVGTIATTYTKDITDWQNKGKETIKRRSLLMRTGQLLSSLAHTPFDTSVERIYGKNIDKECQTKELEKAILDINN